MPHLDINKTAFKSWAKTYGKKTCGHPNLPGECPIARFLRETTRRNANVQSDSISFGPYHLERFSIPQWASDFIERVDLQDKAVSGFRACDIIDEELGEEI